MEMAAGSGRDMVVQGLVRDGADVRLVQVYAAYTRGFAGIQLLGDLAEVCRSGKERARAALENIGIRLGAQKLVLGFTPAGIRIDGAHMDLPVAIALATARNSGAQPQAADGPTPVVFAAEVGLAGELRPVPGIVALALGAARGGGRVMVVAEENLQDLRGIDLAPLRVVGLSSLDRVLDWVEGDASAARTCHAEVDVWFDGEQAAGMPGFEDMSMAPGLARAAMAVAAGRHSILLRGTPGSGKTMFAQRLPGIMPPLDTREKLHALHLHNLAGNSLAAIRGGRVPFRSPHHGASMAAILGSHRCPGEISLAHGGILFLDELPEFRRDLLESLREPLETGEVHLARVQGHVVWAADAILVAASNNCPCGWYASRFRECNCMTGQVAAYQGRMSGPLLDRIDIHFNMPERGTFSRESIAAEPASKTSKWTSQELRKRVLEARDFAARRHQALGLGTEALACNSRIPDQVLRGVPGFLGRRGSDPAQELIEEVAARGTDTEGARALETCQSSSARGLVRALRVARTLADLDTVEVVGYEHFRQALLWQAGAAAMERGDLGRPGAPGQRSRRATWNHVN